MGGKEEGAFVGKRNVVVGAIVLWFLSITAIFIWSCLSQGETFTLLMVEVGSGFADNPAFVHSFLRKWIFVSVFFGAVIVIMIFAENFSWTLGIGRWSVTICPGAKGFRIGCRVIVGMAAIVCACMSVALLRMEIEGQKAVECRKGDLLIAHACGGIDDTKYTNSLNAFENSYEMGIRTIEVDFAITEDDKLVCYHMRASADPEKGIPYTEAGFLDSDLFPGLTLMSLETLLEQMREKEDLWIVTDTKNVLREGVQREMRILLETAREMDCMDVLDRFVVQLYNFEMYDAVEEIYSFNTYILTLYQMGDFDRLDRAQFCDYCRFCRGRGINAITMWDYLAEPEIVEIANQYGVDIYVHTVNNVDRVEELQAIGVKGFYTDYVTPEMME